MTSSDFISAAIRVAVDNGNSLVKFCFDGLEPIFSFPNVVLASEEERKRILNQGDIIDLLDVKIVSPSIPESVGRNFKVGNLAARSRDAKTVVGYSASQMKTKRPETLVTIFTSIAIAVAKKYQEEIRKGVKYIRTKVDLGVGIPINEVREAEYFSNLITMWTHSVTFLSTPGLDGVTIEMQISLPDGISVDDVSGMIDIAAEQDDSLSDKAFGVADIGGVDMDIAFFKPGLILDDYTSGGVRVNLNEKISKIREEFNQTHGQEYITSDIKIIEMLIKRKYDYRHAGKMIGSIQGIAVKHLSELAKNVYTRILDAWNEMPDAEEFLFIGGGSLILGPYIRDINEKEGRPLIFDDEKYSQFRNLRGTYRSLEMALSEKEKETTAGVE